MTRHIFSWVRWRKMTRSAYWTFLVELARWMYRQADCSQLTAPQIERRLALAHEGPLFLWTRGEKQQELMKWKICTVCIYVGAQLLTSQRDYGVFERRMKSGIALTSKPGKGIEFLNTSWILQDCKVTLSDLKEKLLKSSTPPPPAPQLTVAKRMGSPLTI